MNKRLREAEEALRQYVRAAPAAGVSMNEILQQFRGQLEEPELRAAVWKLLAEEEAEVSDQRLKATGELAAKAA
jgi:nitrate/nitrite-specific signal transduction histidine kinase